MENLAVDFELGLPENNPNHTDDVIYSISIGSAYLAFKLPNVPVRRRKRVRFLPVLGSESFLFVIWEAHAYILPMQRANAGRLRLFRHYFPTLTTRELKRSGCVD